MKQLYNIDLAQYQRFLGEKTKLRRQITISVSEDKRHQPPRKLVSTRMVNHPQDFDEALRRQDGNVRPNQAQPDDARQTYGVASGRTQQVAHGLAGTRERLRSMVPSPVRPLCQRLQAGLGRSTARFTFSTLALPSTSPGTSHGSSTFGRL